MNVPLRRTLTHPCWVLLCLRICVPEAVLLSLPLLWRAWNKPSSRRPRLGYVTAFSQSLVFAWTVTPYNFTELLRCLLACVICGSKVERLVACPVKIHKPCIGNYNFSSPNGWSATHQRRKWQMEGFSSSIFHCLPSGAFSLSLKMPQIHEKTDQAWKASLRGPARRP